MGIKPKTISTRVSLSFFFLNILACAPSLHFYLQNGGQQTHAHLDKILADKPLSPDQNIRVVTLGKGRVTTWCRYVTGRLPTSIKNTTCLW